MEIKTWPLLHWLLLHRNLQRFATEDSWYYKQGTLLPKHLVDDPLKAYEKALKRTEFKGSNERGRLFNPTLEEMRDHQKERPNSRFSDEIDETKDIYESEDEL